MTHRESARWLAELVAAPRDPVFHEALEALLPLTGARGAALVTTSAGLPQVLAAVGETGAGAWHTFVPIDAGDGRSTLGITLAAPGPVAADRLAGLNTIAGAFGRLVRERRAARLPADGMWGVGVVHADGTVLSLNPRLCDHMGFAPEELIGRSVFDLLHPDDHALAIDSLARVTSVPGEKYPLDLRFLRSDGTSTILEVTAEMRVDVTVDHVMFTVRPAEERSPDDALVGEQVRVLDMIGRGEWAGNILAEIARLASGRLGVACAVLLVSGADHSLTLAAVDGVSDDVQALLAATTIGADANTCGLAVHVRSALRSGDLGVDPVWAPHGDVLARAGFGSCWADPIDSVGFAEPLGVLAFFGPRGWTPSAQDVRAADLFASMTSVAVQRSEAEAHLTYQATHDPLTGLPNRALFLDRLERALEARVLAGSPIAVMFLDLDRFKVINDALGHEAGDDLLVSVASRIRSVIDPGTCVARFGGDEFTVLVDPVDSADAALAIAHRIVGAFQRPLRVGTSEVFMTISVGIVLSKDHRVRASTMLRDADAAMYRAKHRGRNRVEVFDDAMRAVAVARLDLEHALRGSVERGDFALHYQPEIDLDRLEVVGTEALLRWDHPVRGQVAPADFIPVAEETGAIVELGDWVLAEACRQLARWDDSHGAPAPRMWVNMSVVQLLHPDFPRRVRRLIEAAGLDPDRLGLEITESALMTDVDAAIVSLKELKDLGVRTAIDDFGTGYASLAYLRRLPVDLVKLDHTFVHDLAADERGAAIVGAIVDLVHATGAQVIAEGVETEAQFTALRMLGCDGAQGHWIGRPAEPSALVPSFSWAG